MNQTPRLDDRRDRLIGAAARLFREIGYERTSVRQLAEAVGILSGSVFHHFSSKEDILMAVMSTTIEAMTDALRSAVRSDNVAGQLFELVRTELELLHGDTRDGVAVAFFQWHSLGKANQKKVLALREEYEAVWLGTLDAARRAGLIHTDPFITRRLLTGATGWTIYWYRPDGVLDLDELAREITRLLMGSGELSVL